MLLIVFLSRFRVSATFARTFNMHDFRKKSNRKSTYCSQGIRTILALVKLVYNWSVATKKNPAAVALAKLRAASMTAAERQECARKGGLVGGKARAANLTPKRRREIARKAAAARWGKGKENKL
jgi:hypothetical protein